MVNTTYRTVAVAALAGWIVCTSANAQVPDDQQPTEAARWSSPLDEANHLYYSGRYEAAAALALEVREQDPASLAASELRTTALHFQIRRALGEPKDRDRAWKLCDICQQVMPEFLAELAIGQAAARARLAVNPLDDEALFFLGKLDLNYVWLQLATVGRKTGWKEYWEARKSLDEVLKRHPDHVRARVARAWIDYIVDTKLPRGTKWLLGGGNKKRGLLVVREAAETNAEPFVRAEAMFALWDMQVRERNFAEAVVTARALSQDFPDNGELTKFIAAQDLQTSR
jgi:tetratricopeptide (TPR) repeat protein